MTTPLRNDSDEETEKPFREWIRSHPELDSVRESLSIQNNDVWIHRFSARQESKRLTIAQVIDHLAHLEVKSFCADKPFSQRDTFGVIDDILRKVTTFGNRRRPIKIRDRRRPGCVRQVRWLGSHLLQMSSDRPDNSDRIIWDGKHEITEQMLVEILRFDRDPDHIGNYLDTRRHHKRLVREMHPDLFVVDRAP